MVFYANVAYEEVLRLVIEGLRPLLGDEGLMQSTVSKGAISQARGRVGSGPLKALYQEQVQPHGSQGMPGVFYRGLRIMAIDGSTLEESAVIATHSRRMGRDKTITDPQHCLSMLERRPGALRNGLPFQNLPRPITATFWRPETILTGSKNAAATPSNPGQN